MNDLYPCTVAEANALRAQSERKKGNKVCESCEDPDVEIHCMCERCGIIICEGCTFHATQHNFIDYNCCNSCAEN